MVTSLFVFEVQEFVQPLGQNRWESFWRQSPPHSRRSWWVLVSFLVLVQHLRGLRFGVASSPPPWMGLKEKEKPS